MNINDINNLDSVVDPFAKGDRDKATAKVHIRIKQLNGRKCVTTIEGLASNLDFKKITKVMKKEFQCNGTVIADDKFGEVLQLSGDQRINVREFFINQVICDEDLIVIH